jgi:hypothetical protein
MERKILGYFMGIGNVVGAFGNVVWAFGNVVWVLGIFYGHLVFLFVICYIFSVLVYLTKKNLATL